MTLILLFHQRYSRSGFLGPLVTRTETTAGRSLRLIAGCLAGLVALMQATAASTVRPFVTDDARVVYPRQLEMEIFPKLPLRGAEAELPRAVAARGLATDRLEIIAGGFGPVYEHGQVKPWT